MTEKRFKIVNDCGDYHLMNGDEQLGYDLCSYSMRKTNWNNVVDKLNEQEDKLKRIEKEVDCNVYRDDLKDIILEIRCILNGDVE